MSAERVRAARELLGLSQEELADAAGISQGLVSQIERQNRPATEATMRAIASGTGLSWTFFTRVVPEPQADSLRFRKYRTASPRATTRARRTLLELSAVSSTLLQWATQPVPSLPALPASVDATDGLIEEVATQTRHVLNIDAEAPIRHLTRAMERASVPVTPIVFSELANDEVDEFAAIGHFGMSSRNTESGRPIVAYFPSGGDRQRFTLAHELGHLILHGAAGASTSNSAVVETQADRFAGALLLPRVFATEVMGERTTLRDFARLKAEWGLSIQALVMRAWHLGLIDEQRRSSLFKQISARGWRRIEPVIVHNEEPVLLGTIIQRRFAGSRAIYTRAADDLGLPAVLLRATMPPPLSQSRLPRSAVRSVVRLEPAGDGSRSSSNRARAGRQPPPR